MNYSKKKSTSEKGKRSVLRISKTIIMIYITLLLQSMKIFIFLGMMITSWHTNFTSKSHSGTTFRLISVLSEEMHLVANLALSTWIYWVLLESMYWFRFQAIWNPFFSRFDSCQRLSDENLCAFLKAKVAFLAVRRRPTLLQGARAMFSKPFW